MYRVNPSLYRQKGRLGLKVPCSYKVKRHEFRFALVHERVLL